MSTNSLIGIRENGHIRAIYCHWDGYPECVGALLYGHYTSASKVKKLLSLGSLSVLGERLEPRDGFVHTFDKPQDGVTIAYHRDRGDEFSKAQKVKESEMHKLNWGEYAYIFDTLINKWVTYKCVGVNDSYTERQWSPISVDTSRLIYKAITDFGMGRPRGFK